MDILKDIDKVLIDAAIDEGFPEEWSMRRLEEWITDINFKGDFIEYLYAKEAKRGQ